MNRWSSWSFGAELLLLLLLVMACRPDAGRATLDFTWEGGRPSFERDVFLRLAVEVDGATLRETTPTLLRMGERIDFPPLPHGEGREVVAEILTARFANSRVLYQGRSEVFDFGAGDERTVAIRLRPVMNASRPAGPLAPDPSRIVYRLRPWRTAAGGPSFRVVGEAGASEPGFRVVAFSAEEISEATELGETDVEPDGSFDLTLEPTVAPSARVFVATVWDLLASDADARPDLQATPVSSVNLATAFGADTPHTVYRTPHFDEAARGVTDRGRALTAEEAERLVDEDQSQLSVPGDGFWRNRTRRPDLPGPGARGRHAMVFDTARNRVILFGGKGADREDTDQTWSLNDRGWRRLAEDEPAPAPRRYGHGMVYDRARDEVLLFGGASGVQPLADTWRFDDEGWREVPTTVAPPERFSHAMAYDPVGGNTLLFGGLNANVTPLGDTWIWDGAAWSEVEGDGPPPRTNARMAYLPERRQMVLFGGQQIGAPDPVLDDTWVFDLATRTWSVVAVVGPSARFQHELVTDPDGGVRLFGGFDNLDLHGDTHIFDGDSWRLVAATPISGRRHHRMVSRRSDVLLFGGDTGGGFVDELYVLTGTTAAQVRFTAAEPAPRGRAAAIHDDASGSTLLYGGLASEQPATWLSDLWVWDGRNWTEVGSTPAPLTDPRFGWAGAPALIGRGADGMETYRFDGAALVPWGATATAAWAGVAPARTEFDVGQDPATGRMLLLGGREANQPSDAVFAFDRVQWTRRSVTLPRPTYLAAVAPSATGEVLMFGGRDLDGPFSDLFLFDGASFQTLGAPGPEARWGAGLSLDGGRGVPILFGGEDAVATRRDDLWELREGAWVELTATGPAGRSRHAQVWDPGRSALLMFGGCLGSCVPVDGETWSFVRDASARPGLVIETELGLDATIVSVEARIAGDARTLRVWDAATGSWTAVGAMDRLAPLEGRNAAGPLWWGLHTPDQIGEGVSALVVDAIELEVTARFDPEE